MKKIVAAFLLIASCSSGEGQQGGGNAAVQAQQDRKAAPSAAAPSGPITNLVGLYDGGNGQAKHQMCVVEGKGGANRFGLIIWGDAMHSCSGSGTASREGDRLKLSMSGDVACTVEARISGNKVTMPQGVPEGCSYYCGARATFGGAELVQRGATEADALKAQDFVGEPLCGAEGQ